MNPRCMSLAAAALLVACVVPVTAQPKLGDMVAENGYEWIMGRWVATTDEGQKVEFKYDWVLDKHAVLADVKMAEFNYRGLVMLAPGNEEIFDVGADNRGGLWKGTWSEGQGGLVHQVEHTSPDGQVRKAEIVYEKTGADSVSIAMYGVDDSGNRNSEAWGKLTYKRQAAEPAGVTTPAGQSRSRDYQTLSDLVSEGGYDWIIGKWLATKEDRTYELEYKPILDQHAAQADVKIGDSKYLSIITYVARRQEIVDFGVDNSGGTWKGTWEQDGSDAVNKIEYTRPDGTSWKRQHVYVKINNDEMKVKQYDVGTDGSRASQPNEELTFKRQKTVAPPK